MYHVCIHQNFYASSKRAEFRKHQDVEIRRPAIILPMNSSHRIHARYMWTSLHTLASCEPESSPPFKLDFETEVFATENLELFA